MARTAKRDVELSAIYQPNAALGIDVDDYPIHGRALGRVRSRRVAVIDVVQPRVGRRYLATAVGAETSLTSINRDDRSELAVGDSEGPVRRAKLNAISDGKRACLRAEDLDTPQAARTVLDSLTALGSKSQDVALEIRRLDPEIAAGDNTELRAATTEAKHVAHSVM